MPGPILRRSRTRRFPTIATALILAVLVAPKCPRREFYLPVGNRNGEPRQLHGGRPNDHHLLVGHRLCHRSLSYANAITVTDIKGTTDPIDPIGKSEEQCRTPPVPRGQRC